MRDSQRYAKLAAEMVHDLEQSRLREKADRNPSCNACIKIASRRGIHIGMHVTVRCGSTAEVTAINHIHGRVHLLVAGDQRESCVWLPLNPQEV